MTFDEAIDYAMKKGVTRGEAIQHLEAKYKESPGSVSAAIPDIESQLQSATFHPMLRAGMKFAEMAGAIPADIYDTATDTLGIQRPGEGPLGPSDTRGALHRFGEYYPPSAAQFPVPSLEETTNDPTKGFIEKHTAWAPLSDVAGMLGVGLPIGAAETGILKVLGPLLTRGRLGAELTAGLEEGSTAANLARGAKGAVTNEAGLTEMASNPLRAFGQPELMEGVKAVGGTLRVARTVVGTGVEAGAGALEDPENPERGAIQWGLPGLVARGVVGAGRRWGGKLAVADEARGVGAISSQLGLKREEFAERKDVGTKLNRNLGIGQKEFVEETPTGFPALLRKGSKDLFSLRDKLVKQGLEPDMARRIVETGRNVDLTGKSAMLTEAGLAKVETALTRVRKASTQAALERVKAAEPPVLQTLQERAKNKFEREWGGLIGR